MNSSFKINGIAYQEWLELTHSNELELNIAIYVNEWQKSKNSFLFKTSGSTGLPKIISVKRSVLEHSAKATGTYFKLRNGDKSLLCLPVQYIAGRMMLIRAMVLGLDLYLSLPQVNELLDNQIHFDFCAMTPFQVSKIIDKKKSFFNFIDKLIIGGGKIDFELEKKLISLSSSCFSTYGMTETVSHVALKEITAKGNVLFEGLPGVRFSRNKNKQLIIHAPKWGVEKLLTNDIVEINSDSSFEWIGRLDNVINSGGIKIYPEKVESKLSGKIKDSFFISKLPDESLGNKLILVIEGTKRKLDFSHISKYERPKEVYFLPKFEYTETGKINRSKTLKEL